ncbi:MAG: AAA family ATPase [Proteobacteria bacterium]|nr:AAA family ATPase [Pseudomonadota bacterium]
MEQHSNNPENPLVQRFIDSFKKAIRTEMDAMRKRLGPFEVPLSKGNRLETDDVDQNGFYTFRFPTPNDKLILHSECTLRYEKTENLVTITGIDKDEITLLCQGKVDLDPNDHTLVIYPWFLYERLLQALDSLVGRPNHFVSNALMLFGKHPPQRSERTLRSKHPELNRSQNKAVQLCADSNLAFVWGPPGTGKTTTLGHIVTELLARKKRVLITSTTNAAVDQALEKLSNLTDAQKYLNQGQILRIGQSGQETFGAGLSEVTRRLNKENLEKLHSYRNRRRSLQNKIKHCEQLVRKLKTDSRPQQLTIFGEVESGAISETDLDPVFETKRKRTLLNLPPDLLLNSIAHRQKRITQLSDLYREKIAQVNQESRRQEAAAVRGAKAILSTMANVYISSLLEGERFDAIIVEEAGMAVLPTLFYCATLSREKVIMVGDPKQLPPIIQSREKYAQKAMGRNIFDVTVPDSDASEFVMMLDTQYRMHPSIGDLVSRLFYGGKLKNGKNTHDREPISDKEPYPGSPLVVVDTHNLTTCQIREGSFSRFNEKSAEFCLDLAKEAVRSGIESVAIITPYAAQARLIGRHLNNRPGESRCIECRTVHRFQGGERDLVILDTVDTSPLSPGILLTGQGPDSSAENLINVAISRARGKLVIVSDLAYFKLNSPRSTLHKMLQYIIRNGKGVSMPTFPPPPLLS